MSGQLDGLRQQYESNTKRQDFNEKFLTGASQRLVGSTGQQKQQVSPVVTSKDQEAINWAKANPLDLRAIQIKALHGM